MVDAARAVFEVEPGPLQLDLSIHSLSGGVIDNDILHFVVPNFTGTEVSLGSPRVFRAQNAFEMRQLRANPDPIPETGREFRRTDRLLVQVDAYGPGAVGPDVTAKLLNRGGQSMADLPVQVPVGDAAYRVLDLPLASLAPGEYLIELTATIGDGTAQQLIAIRVTS